MPATFRISLIFFILAATGAMASIRLPQLIGDNMVLQRDKPVKIWGWAVPNEAVTVTFRGKRYQTVTAADSTWKILLPPQKAGTGFEMTLKGENQIHIRNIAFGDVWLCNGQSNMVINMERVKERYGADIAAADFPDIRNFFIPAQTDLAGPRQDLPASQWKVANKENILSFGAVSYFFARELYERYRVPIGIINSSVGGTPIEAWISEQGYKDFSEIREVISRNKGDKPRQTEPAVKQAGNGDRGLQEHWESETYQPKGWRNFTIPGYWEDQGVRNLDGVVWFRKEIDVPASWAGKAAKVFMGRIVDADQVYVNGERIGGTTYQYPPRRYQMPAGLLRAGKNTIVVRVVNQAEKGGFVPDKLYYMEADGQQIDLKGTWQYKVGQVYRPGEMAPNANRFVAQNQPAALYNAMIAPLLHVKLKGFVWYQGESNVGNAKDYNQYLPALIRDRRSLWNNENLPFLVVQLPNFQDVDYLPAESDWAVLREAQHKALALKNTAVAVTIDLGEWNDIHPLNKKDIGHRLALAAQHLAYQDQNIIFSGPTLQSQTVTDGRILLTFDHVADGIIASDGEELRWFAVAGDDGKFAWAKARIIGKNQIELTSDDVKSPKFVRYAWQDNPDQVNFYNSAGLPASPFRTDPQH